MDYTYHIDSPLGGITLASDGQALTGLWFDGQKHFAETLAPDHAEKLLPVFEETLRWLDLYFSGRFPDFTPPLAPRGSAFRQAVWRVLLTIPCGRTMTYTQAAEKISGSGGTGRASARAVGGAVGHNPISLIIPCHRVLGTGGSLTGYAGGVEKKERLLQLEQVMAVNAAETLEGPRLRLRKARETDCRSMLENIWGDEAVTRWMLHAPARTEAEALDRCRRCMQYQQENYAWFVALKDTDEAIGLCAIRETSPGHFEEAGIGIGTKHQGKGYGKELVALLLDFSFRTLGALDVRYGYFHDNVRSKKLAESFGFRYDRSFDLIRPWDGAVMQIDSCLLTREQWARPDGAVLPEQPAFSAAP